MNNQIRKTIARDLDTLNTIDDFRRQNQTDFLAYISRIAKRDILTIAR